MYMPIHTALQWATLGKTDTHTHPTDSVMTPGSPERIRQDTAGVIKLYWASDRLGRNHTGKQGPLHAGQVWSSGQLAAQGQSPVGQGVWLGCSQQK